MRESHRCTKCGVTELLYLHQTGHFGHFEAFICVECGYNETYAHKGARAVLKKSAGAETVRGRRELGQYHCSGPGEQLRARASTFEGGLQTRAPKVGLG